MRGEAMQGGIHSPASDDERDGMVRRVMPPLEEALAAARMEHTEREAKAFDGGPDDMPELLRELIQLDGALTGAERCAANLIAVLDAHLPHDAREKIEVVLRERAERGLTAPPLTPYGHRLRKTQDRLGALEELLGMYAGALARVL